MGRTCDPSRVKTLLPHAVLEMLCIAVATHVAFRALFPYLRGQWHRREICIRFSAACSLREI
jgi:hypothetical protein